MNNKFYQLHQKILEILDEDCLVTIGLRATRSKIESKIGRELKPSCVWIDGKRTNERLDGVSTIGIEDDSEEALIDAIRLMGKTACEEFGVDNEGIFGGYYDKDEDDIILVVGDGGDAGEDKGETVIKRGVTKWSLKATK